MYYWKLFSDVKEEVPVGGKFVVGTRAEPKTYYIMKSEDGCDVELEGMEIKMQRRYTNVKILKELRNKLRDLF